MIFEAIPALSKMDSCANELHSLGSDTEPEFLIIGDLLNKLADICFGMTENARELSSLFIFRATEEPEVGSITDEKKLFGEISSHVNKTLSSLNEGESLLDDLLTQIKELRVPIQDICITGETFHVLGTSIKVESSRTRNESQSFQLLADEVAEISTFVQNSCQNFTSNMNVAEKDINTSKHVLRHINSYDESGEQAITIISSVLDDVGSKLETLSAKISARSAVMVQGLNDVVMAMQFHDITRQQLENISHALLVISEKTKMTSSELSSYTEQSDEQIAFEIYGILSIQVAHLNSIYEQIINAEQQIETGLDIAMDQAQTQATDAGSLLKFGGGEVNNSVVAILEKETDNVSISLNKSLTIVSRAAAVSRSVNRNISEIGTFVYKMEKIAFDVKVLALNVTVEAVKTGDSGNALIVLAKELSDLSQKVHKGTTKSINIFKILKEGTKKQLEFSETLDRERDAVDELIQQAKQLTETILSSLQGMSLLALKMEGSYRDLASRITRLQPGITFTKVMGDGIDKNWMILCCIIKQIEENYPQFIDDNSAVAEMLENLTEQYVMDRERTIHAQVAGIDLDNGKGQGSQANGDEFEDNIELF